MAASVRWAAEQFGWALDVPSLDDEWMGGCDEAARDGYGRGAYMDMEQEAQQTGASSSSAGKRKRAV